MKYAATAEICSKIVVLMAINFLNMTHGNFLYMLLLITKSRGQLNVKLKLI